MRKQDFSKPQFSSLDLRRCSWKSTASGDCRRVEQQSLRATIVLHLRWMASLFLLLALMSSFAWSQAQELSHPWIADAPGEIARLIGLGNVRIVVDDDRIKDSNKLALTAFQLKSTYKIRFFYEWISLGNQTEVWKARIVANVLEPRLTLEHQVIIPSTFRPTDPWKTDLMKHEFDHVSISTDPRLFRIMERVFKRKRVLMEEWLQPAKPSDGEIRSRLELVLAEEVNSCEALIQRQYDWLDQQTMNGRESLESRMAFFQELYTFPGLQRCDYAHRDTVKEYLEKKVLPESIKEFERHYLSLK